MDTNQGNARGMTCNCKCHSFKGWVVVVFGAVFLLGQAGVFSAEVVGWVWPIIIIVAGLKAVFKSHCKC
jgi:hypothetical protein